MNKSIIYVILTFLILQIGQGSLAALSCMLFPLAFSLCIAILAFSIPFLYLLYKKTGISIISCVSDSSNTGFLLLKLLCLAIGLALLNLFFANILNPNLVVQEGEAATIPENIAHVLDTILLAPVVEELFYRKWMISYLERSRVKHAIILSISSLLFFFAHTNWGTMSFRFDTIIFGIVLFLVYTKYSDVIYCIFVHSINNLTITLLQL